MLLEEMMQCLKPRLHISRKDPKHMFVNTLFKLSNVCLGLHIVVMIAAIHISQQIFAIDMLPASKPFYKLVCLIDRQCQI